MATDLRGSGSYNSVFLRRKSEKKYENWSTFAEVTIKNISGTFFLRHGVYQSHIPLLDLTNFGPGRCSQSHSLDLFFTEFFVNLTVFHY